MKNVQKLHFMYQIYQHDLKWCFLSGFFKFYSKYNNGFSEFNKINVFSPIFGLGGGGV